MAKGTFSFEFSNGKNPMQIKLPTLRLPTLKICIYFIQIVLQNQYVANQNFHSIFLAHEVGYYHGFFCGAVAASFSSFSASG